MHKGSFFHVSGWLQVKNLKSGIPLPRALLRKWVANIFFNQMQQLFDFKYSFFPRWSKRSTQTKTLDWKEKQMFGNPENAQRKIQKHRLLNMSDLWGVTAATLHFVHTVACTYAVMLNEIIREGHCQLDLSCTDAHHLLWCWVPPWIPPEQT